MLRSRRTLGLLAMTAVLALVAAACGEEVDDAPVADEPADEAADDPAEDEAAEPEEDDAAPEDDAAAAATVALGSSDLGDHLVDGDGMTLYLFTQDPAGESVCTDDCADAWPPLTVDGEVAAGDGVDAALLATITRDDGSEQVTYADQPLYYFAADASPGDVEGQGVNDVWWVVAADGAAIQAAAGGDDDEGEERPGY